MKLPEDSWYVRLSLFLFVFCLLCLVPFGLLPKAFVLNPAFLISWNILVWSGMILGLSLATIAYLMFFFKKSDPSLRKRLLLTIPLVFVFFIGFIFILYIRFPDLIPKRYSDTFSWKDYFALYTPSSERDDLFEKRDYHSIKFPFSVILENSEWQPWRDAYRVHPKAEFGAHHPDEAFFVVIPYYLPAGKPDLKIMANAALTGVGLSPENCWKGKWMRQEQEGYEGFVFDFEEQAQESAYRYRWKLLANDQMAFWMGAWARSSPDERIDEIFDRTILREKASTQLSPDQMTLDEKIRHSEIFKSMGELFLKDDRIEEARKHFDLAKSFNPADLNLENLIKNAEPLTETEEMNSESNPNAESANIRPNAKSSDEAVTQSLTPAAPPMPASNETTGAKDSTAQNDDGNGKSADAPPGIHNELIRYSVYFEPGTPIQYVERRIIRVAEEKLAQKFVLMPFAFNIHIEDISLDHLIIQDVSGYDKVVDTAYPLLTLHSGRSATANQSTHLFNVPIPPLAHGDLVDIQVTRTNKTPSEHMEFVEYSFSTAIPTKRHEFSIHTQSISTIQYKTSGPLIERKTSDHLAWLFSSESPSPAPVLWIGARFHSWQHAVRDYLSGVAVLYDPTADDHKTAVKLSEDAPDKASKIVAVINFVRTVYTHEPMKFQTQQRDANHLQEFASAKRGDSVDLTLSAVRLFKTLEIEVYPALVKSAGGLINELFSLDQFDAMLLFLPEPDGDGYFMDVTDSSKAWNELRNEILNRDVLILDPENPRWSKTI